MKPRILLLFLLGWAEIFFAQIQTKVFTLNLGEPTINSLQAKEDDKKIPRLVVRTNEPLAFNLINGNPYKYRYVINHQLVDLFAGKGYNPLDSIGKIITNGNAIPKDAGTEKVKNDLKINSLIDSIKSLSSKKNVLINSNKILGNKMSGTFDTQIKELDKKLAFFKEELVKAQLESPYTSLSPYSTSFINGKKAKNETEDKSNIRKASEVLQKSYNNLKVDVDTYIAEVSAEDFLDSSKFKDKRKTFNESYIRLLFDTQSIGNEAANFADELEEFNKKAKAIDSISLKIKNEISKMYQMKLHNYLLPIDINGKNIDLVEVVLERYDKTVTSPAPDKYTYNIWVKGGLKIDISGGVFLTSLMDREYETKDDTGNNKFIYEKDKGNYDFGFGSVINLSLRGGSWVRPSLSIGALFTTNQKFQILSGIGLILGKEERVILHGGLTMGSVSRISDKYKTDGTISYDLGTEGSVTTNNKFCFGHFFGITYNFGKVKKQEIAK